MFASKHHPRVSLWRCEEAKNTTLENILSYYKGQTGRCMQYQQLFGNEMQIGMSARAGSSLFWMVQTALVTSLTELECIHGLSEIPTYSHIFNKRCRLIFSQSNLFK